MLAKITDAERRKEIAGSIDALRDQRSWDEASQEATAAGFNAYLAARPEGMWASEARKRLARLQEKTREREPRDWDAAWEDGSVVAWDRYLAVHSESARAAEARRWRQEAADFDLAVSANSRNMWRAFLKAWPEGRHRIDAEIRSRSAK